MVLVSEVPDLTAVEWLGSSSVRAPRTVADLVGVDLPVYVRILHPAGRVEGGTCVDVRWDVVARANGRRMHPEVEWGSITGSWSVDAQPPAWEESPDSGALTESVARGLAKVLRHVGADSGVVWAGTWEGWDTEWPDLEGPVCRFNATGREMLAYSGETAKFLPASPQDTMRDYLNLCWSPAGHWCVSTDIDLNSTVIGASEDIAARILESEDLEAYRVSPDQKLTWDTDKINPLPAPPS